MMWATALVNCLTRSASVSTTSACTTLLSRQQSRRPDAAPASASDDENVRCIRWASDGSPTQEVGKADYERGQDRASERCAARPALPPVRRRGDACGSIPNRRVSSLPSSSSTGGPCAADGHGPLPRPHSHPTRRHDLVPRRLDFKRAGAQLWTGPATHPCRPRQLLDLARPQRNARSRRCQPLLSLALGEFKKKRRGTGGLAPSTLVSLGAPPGNSDTIRLSARPPGSSAARPVRPTRPAVVGSPLNGGHPFAAVARPVRWSRRTTGRPRRLGMERGAPLSPLSAYPSRAHTKPRSGPCLHPALFKTAPTLLGRDNRPLFVSRAGGLAGGGLLWRVRGRGDPHRREGPSKGCVWVWRAVFLKRGEGQERCRLGPCPPFSWPCGPGALATSRPLHLCTLIAPARRRGCVDTPAAAGTPGGGWRVSAGVAWVAGPRRR